MNRRYYRRRAQRHKRRIFVVFLLLLLEEVNRSCWVHPINLERKQKGEFYRLYPDLRHFRDRFTGMYRLDVQKMEELLAKVSPLITKKWTYMREPISAEQRLILTLR